MALGDPVSGTQEQTATGVTEEWVLDGDFVVRPGLN
jgi:hypothetical protein